MYLPSVLVYPYSPSLSLLYSVYNAYVMNGFDWLPTVLTHQPRTLDFTPHFGSWGGDLSQLG